MKLHLSPTLRSVFKTITGWGFFILMIACTLTAQAQIEVGVKAGANAAYESFKSQGTAFSIPPRIGFSGGVYGLVKIRGKVSLQPEVLFSQQGGKGTTKGVSVDDNLSYLLIPVLCRFQVNSRFSLQAGPQFGYLLSATSFGFDVLPSYKQSEIAAALGAELKLPGRFGIGARFTTGLTSTNSSSTTTRTNSVGQIYVLYSLTHL